MSQSARRSFAVALGILILTCTAYSNSLYAPFQFDDFGQIVNNQHIRRLSGIPGYFHDPGVTSEFVGHKGYRPLLIASFAVNYWIGGYGRLGYHVFNLLLHLVCAFLVYLIAGLVMSRQDKGGGGLVPAAAALVFAAHPIQTGAVTYISGRSVMMAGFFVLAAVYCFINHRASSGRGSLAWPAGALFFFTMGLFTKEVSISFIGLVLAYDFVFTWPEKGVRHAAVWWFYAASAAILAFYLAARKTFLGFVSIEPGTVPSVASYLMSEIKTLPMYMRLMLFPVNQNADYAAGVISSPDMAVAASLVLIISTWALLYYFRRREPAAAFFGAWFFIALAPESSVFPILDVAVEYRLYLASAGFIAAAVIAVSRLVKTPVSRKAFAAVVLLCLFSLTYTRNAVWSSELNLWSDVARKSPMSPRAHMNLGVALMRNDRCEEAVQELNRALEINPQFNQRGKVHNNLGMCYSYLGNPEAAIEEYNKALKDMPGLDVAHVNVGKLYYEHGRYEEALDAFIRARKIGPYRAETSYYLGLTESRLGQDKEALEDMRRALEYSPRDFDISLELAELYRKNGMLPEALEQARASLDLAEFDEQRMRAQALLDQFGGGGGFFK